MHNKQSFYNNFYKLHGSRVHDDPVRFSKIAELCKGSVLDLGCGTGTLADFYKGEYTGVDISNIAIEQAKQTRRFGSKFFCDDIFNPELFGNFQFDTIVIAEVLEHLDDDVKLFNNIKRLLKQYGRVIISTPNGDRVPDDDHIRQFTCPELRRKFSVFGCVSFYNYAGFSNRILMVVDFNGPVLNNLALSMVVKNEGLGLENAILSCIDKVDQIVIAVDSASDDNTLEIAKRYADKCEVYIWENSFCKARNFAQSLATTKWVLILDGHEFVEKMPDLTQYWNSHFTGIKAEVKLENGFRFNFPRIIRQSVRWTKDVHNYPETYQNAFCEGFVVVHDREGKQTEKAKEIRDKQRDEMILRCMADEIKKDPKAFTPWYYLAQHYFLKKQFRKSIRYYRQYLKRSTWKGERWLVYFDIAQARAHMGQFVRAAWSLRDADRELPNRWEINFLRGMMLLMTENWFRAIEQFVESFKENTGKFTYYPVQRDSAFVWQCIGYCFEKLNKLKEAKMAYTRAYDLENAKDEKEQDKERLEILKFLLKVA